MTGRLRTLALLLPLTIAAPLFAPLPSAVASEDDEEGKMTWAADVKIEAKQENGKVVTKRFTVDSFDMDWPLKFEGQGHKHIVTLNIKAKDDKARKLEVTLAYERDGVEIIAPFTSDWTAKKRDFVKTDDGQFAIALTIKPKRVKAKDQSRDDDEQVDPDGGDDPLGGLKLR